MSLIRSTTALAIALCSAALAAPASATVFVFDPPDVDRWNYPFNSTPGTRTTTPLFGAFQTAGTFDERDGQALLIFDTAPEIPTGRPLAAYGITSARVVLDLSPAGSFVYDPSYDGYRTYLALENPADPDQLPDTDAGRPIELYGVGYRLGGLNALTYNETTTPFAAAMGADQRYAYPNDNRAHATLFGARDVSNNVLDRFEARPFSVGTVVGATPGATVSSGTVEMPVTLSAPVLAYLRERLAQGSVDLMVTTLLPASQGGPVAYPVLYTKESGTGAATLEIDVTITPACSDGVDNDGDGQADLNDSGCNFAADDSEQFDCQDGADNDGDGFTDYPADPGCQAATSVTEKPQCSDGVDNDNDNKIDFPADPHCASIYDNREKAKGCGLLGVEGLPFLAWAAWTRRRARRA